MKKSIVLIGGGGHCRSCVDVIEAAGCFTIAGIIDAAVPAGQMAAGYPVLGDDSYLPEAIRAYVNVLITVGQIRSAETRARLFAQTKRLGASLPVVFSPHAIVSSRAIAGEGTIVMHRAVVNANAQIGANAIINTGAIVEHDVLIEDHCHISTGAIINGGCSIGSGCFVGSGAVLAEGVTVPQGTIIAAGSVVLKSLSASGLYAGTPARRIR